MHTQNKTTHTFLSNWDDVRILRACLDSRSLSEASKLLGVQQSTVSRRLAAMEDALGAALFTRTPEGILPTPLATQMRRNVDAVAEHLYALGRLGQGADPRPVGEVSLAVTESMALHYMLPRASTLTQAYPGLYLNLVTSYSLTDLVRREADLALRFVRPTQLDLVVKKLASIELRVLAHPDYLKNHGPPTLESGLWAYLNVPGMITPEQHWFDTHIKTPPWLKSTSYTTIMEAVLKGYAVGLMPAPMALESPSPLHVIELGVAYPDPLELWLTAHADLRHTPKVDAVWRWLVAQTKALNEEGGGEVF